MTANDEHLRAYVREHFSDHDDLLAALMPAAEAAGLPQISIAPEEGRIFQLLLRAIGARKVLEIGTLGGYSAISMARALPPDGKLITLERSGKHAAFAREWIGRAGFSNVIEVREGPALETLPRLAGEAPFDAVFIDANKEDYPQYLDWALRYARAGGLIIAHNAFMQGRIVDQAGADRGVAAMQEFNRRVATEPRLLSALLLGGDGIAVGLVVEP
ncbi:MAG TPA: O-methyltransferase [Roseiflexaceae bacterium]|nr:O-methyltransferase [Roseiflexaceae bacterium]